MKKLSNYIEESLFDNNLVKKDPLKDFKKSLMEAFYIKSTPKNIKDVDTAVSKWVEFINGSAAEVFDKYELENALTPEAFRTDWIQRDGQLRCQRECPESLIDKKLIILKIGRSSSYSWDNEDKCWVEY